jgi:hypothetical protein
MHRLTRRQLLLTAMVVTLLAGCDRAVSGPQAWIDAPQHNSTHPVAPMDVVMHAADSGGVAQVELSVNGEVLSRRPPDDTTAALVTHHVAWDPQAPGEYVLAARAQNHAGQWSPLTSSVVTLTGGAPPVRVVLPSPTPTAAPLPSATPTPACTNKAAFVADVTIPDNTLIAPGAPFRKVWRLRNDGTCPWTERYQVVFSAGAPMSNNMPLPLPNVVAPGDTIDIGDALVAPLEDGSYHGGYLLRTPQGVLFGVGADGQTPFYVQIIVGTRPTATLPPPPQPDTQAPSVSISHSPSGSSLPTGTSIKFSATASDDVGVKRIDIWVTAPGQFPVLAKTCNNKTTCSYTGGPYSTQGNLSYFAIAADAVGHETNSGAHTITLYVVVK